MIIKGRDRIYKVGFVLSIAWIVLTCQSVSAQQASKPVSLDIPNTVLRLSACAAPEAFVQIYDSNESIDAVVTGSNGRFNLPITYPSNQAGLHNLKIYYDDVNRRTSSVTSLTVNVATQTTTPLSLLLPTTIEHEPEPVGIGNFLIFRGTTCPNALVNLTIDNNFTLAAQADARGNWYIIADTENFYIGAHVYHALSSLKNQPSQPTHKYQFHVTGSAPAVIKQPNLNAPRITEPPDLYLSGTQLVTVRGTGPPNAQIELLVDDQPTGSSFANVGGEWSMTFNMSRDQHTVTARTCSGTECGDLSNSVRLRYAGDFGQCPISFSLARHRFYYVRPNRGIDLTLSDVFGPVTSYMLVDWGDADVETITLGDDTAFKLHHVFKQAGQFSGSISLKEGDNCIFTIYFSVLVAEGEIDRLRLATGGLTLVGIALITKHVILKRRHETPAQPEPTAKSPPQL